MSRRERRGGSSGALDDLSDLSGAGDNHEAAVNETADGETAADEPAPAGRSFDDGAFADGPFDDEPFDDDWMPIFEDDADSHDAPALPSRSRKGAVSVAFLNAGMALEEIVYGRERSRPAVIQEAREGDDDGPIRVHLDPDEPKNSWVSLHPEAESSHPEAESSQPEAQPSQPEAGDSAAENGDDGTDG